jgi:hypothetical protein
MNPRAWLLFGAFLVSPAWSQEFDLRSDSVQKIVRATAATQSVAVHETAEAAATPGPAQKPVAYVPPEKPSQMRELPTRLAPAAKTNPFVSAVIDSVVEDVLGVEPDPAYDFEYEKLKACQQRNADKTAAQRNEACSGGQRAWTIDDQPGFLRPQIR